MKALLAPQTARYRARGRAGCTAHRATRRGTQGRGVAHEQGLKHTPDVAQHPGDLRTLPRLCPDHVHARVGNQKLNPPCLQLRCKVMPGVLPQARWRR
eukprot:1561391-Alexandrium_andersonii.AAC.1